MKKYFLLLVVAAFLFSVKGAAQTPDYNISTSDYWLNKIADPNLNYFEVVAEFENYWEGREPVRHSGYKQFRRWQSWAKYNINADGSLKSPDSDIEAFQQFLKENPTDNTIVGNWELVGPTQFPEQTFSGQCPGLGRISALAFHPTNEQILFAGSPAGGLWKTVDYGESWFEVPIENFKTMGVSSIVVDHTNPNNIYVGTGDRDGGMSWWHGVFKSMDGGLTWEKKNNGLDNRIINKLLMSPQDPQRLIAASHNGIYVTLNGGDTWMKALSTDFMITDMVYKPGFGNSHVVYAAGAGSIYRSLDAGFTWERKKLTDGHRTVLAVTPANPNKVYAFMTKDSKAYRVYSSNNAGENFSYVNVVGMELEGQGGYNLDLAVDPTNENIMFAGMINIYRSINGGQNWSLFANAGQIHADQHILEWSPFHNDILFIGNDGGVYSMLIMGNSHLIKQISDGLAIGQIYRLSTFTENPDLLICGTQDCGSYVTNGGPWNHSYSGDGMNCEIDYENPSIMYATAQNGNIGRSFNGGIDFTKIADKGFNGIYQDGSWYSPFVLDHSNTNIMFAGFQDVWRTTNVKSIPSYMVWQNISQNQLSGKVIDYLFQSPADPQRLFAIDQGGERLFMTLNAYATSPTWTEIANPDPYSFAWVEPHPVNPDLIYVSNTEKIKMYNVLTEQWWDMTGNLPGYAKLCIVYDKNSNGGLYVGTTIGVYYKDVIMDDWVYFKTGLPLTSVRDLQINYHTDPPQLFAATFGRGIWKTEIYPDPRANIKAMSGGSVVVGSNVSVHCNIKNTEPHVTTGDFYAGFYLSDNSSITPADLLFAEQSVSSLDPNGQTVVNSGSLIDLALITPEIPSGTYYLGVFLDKRLEVSESDEYDNVYLANKMVTIAPSPSPPQNLQASKGENTSNVLLLWDAPPSGANYYRVYRNSTNNSASAVAISGWISQGWYEDAFGLGGVDYFYWVKASNYLQGQRASNFSNVAVGWKKLGVPANINASDGEFSNKVRITWSKPSGATHFRVYRNTTNNPQTASYITGSTWITATTFDDFTAQQGTIYYYWVKAAINATGNRPSDFSIGDEGWRALSSGPPVTASDGAFTNKIEITWSVIPGANYYKLFYNTSYDPFSCIALTTWATGTSFTHVPEEPGVIYYYWVKAALDAQGTGSSSFGQYDTGWMNFIPPTNVQATAGTLVEEIQITWSPSADAGYYRVFRANNPVWSQAQPVSYWITGTEFTDQTPTPGRDRFYWVKAAGDTTNTISERSAWCEGWAKIAAPGVTATNGVYPNKVLVSWQNVNGGLYYRVFREEIGAEVIVPLTNWNMNLEGSFEDLTAVFGVNYNYSVKAATTNEGHRESDPGIDSGFAGECGNLIDDVASRQVDLRGRTLHLNISVINEGPNPIVNPSLIAFSLENQAPFGNPDFFLGSATIPPLEADDIFDVSFSVDLDGVSGGPVPSGTWYVACHIPYDQINCQTNPNDDYLVWEDQPFEITDAMYGIYTIGTEDCDYELIGDALSDLQNKGISDNVFFYLEPEYFTEQHVFTAVNGASGTKRIIFMTNPSRSDTAVITFTPSEQQNYTLKLTDASHYVFQNLKIATNGFTNYQSTYGRVIELAGNCNDITISGCTLLGFADDYHMSDNSTVIFSSNSEINGLNINNNIIRRGHTAIRLFGKDLFTGPLSNILIKENILDGFLAEGIVIKDVQGFEIVSNKLLSAENMVSYAKGIYIEDGGSGFNISGNMIILSSSNIVTHGVSLNNVNMVGSQPGLISNNFLSIQGNETYNYGLALLKVAQTKVYHNSINLFGAPGLFSACMMLDFLGEPPAGGLNNYLHNNIVSNQLGGYCIVMNDEALANQYFDDIDYNCYYTSGQYPFLYNSVTDYTFEQWKSITGFDAFSLVENLAFYSDTDLHVNSTALEGAGTHVAEVLTDIDGDPRNLTAPDIGADEFEYIAFYTWTGNVSTDWHTPGNWDPMQVPVAAMNVLIPADRANMPIVEGMQANCRDLTVEGTLTIADKQLLVNGNAIFSGMLSMTNYMGEFNVNGNINWNNGSTATISDDATIRIYGNWNFNQGAQVQMNNGTVNFMGSQSKSIVVKSANCRFNNVIIRKTGNTLIFFDESSTHSLDVKDLSIHYGAGLKENGSGDITVRGFISNSGIMQLNGGTLTLAGDNHTIIPNTDSYFYNLRFNQTGDATIVDIFTGTISVLNDLTISSGVFHAGENIIKVGGNWVNEVGESAFDQGTSRVIFDGSGANKDCTGGEIFNILEVDKSAGGLINMHNVSCAVYDYTSGGINVPANKIFIALDLADNGLYGQFSINEGSVLDLHQDAGQSVNLAGQIEINGDGVINVYGGNGQSIWGQFGNSSLNMNGGVLDFKNAGIFIQNNVSNPFTSNITGGTIRTSGGFSALSPGFNPSGGTVELYGEGSNDLYADGGSAFYNVMINKPDDYYASAIYIIFSVIKSKLIVENGYAQVSTMINTECWNGIEVHDGGRLKVISGGVFMKNLATINIYGNGQLLLSGDLGGMSVIKGINPTDYYSLTVHDGGFLSANHTIFEGLSGNGIHILDGATIDPLNSFYNCTFGNGQSGSTLLTINNDQFLVVNNAVFPANTWSGNYNVKKTADQGGVNFVNATGEFAGAVFENDPYNRIFWDGDLDTYHINLSAEWSGISSHVLPIDNALESVFSPIESNIVSVQTLTGVYIPGENINTIGNWESHSAFRVKTSQACVLPVTGYYETDMTVSLNSGWNLLPVVTPDGADPGDLFTPVNGFVIAKDVAGTGVYWPQYNINSIGYVLPGKAYYVLLTTPGVVDYTGMKSSGNLTGFQNLSGLDETLSWLGYNITPTPSTHTIAILPSALKDIEVGTIIGAFDQNGNCFGITIISDNANHLTIFGDDPTTAEKDGFFEGEMIFFKNLTGFHPARAGLSGLNPTFNQSLPQSDGFFTENGLSAITGFESSTGVGFADFGRLVNIFPNPSEGVVNVTGLQSGAKITVTDVQGQVVVVAETSTAGQTAIDLTDYNAGVYFIKIEINGQNIFRKIVLR